MCFLFVSIFEKERIAYLSTGDIYMRNTRSSQIKIKYENIRIHIAWMQHSAIRYSFFCVCQKLFFYKEKAHIRSPPEDSSYQKIIRMENTK